jgi:DNA-binding transcriptional LysR family regulator
MLNSMRWDDVRFFLTLCREKSLRRAAQGLQVSASTVLRRVNALERGAKVPLFLRNEHGYVPTELGLKLMMLAESAEAKLLAFERAPIPSSEEFETIIRISAPEIFTTRILAPCLAALHRTFPKVTFSVVASNRLSSFTRREADIAIRLNRPEEHAAFARRLASVRSAITASKSYIRKHGEPTFDNVNTHTLVWDDSRIQTAIEARWRWTHAATARVVFQSESTHARLAAAKAGLGLTFLPRYVIASEPSLHLCEGIGAPEARELWMMVHRDERRRRAVREIAESLADALKESVHL